MLNDDAHDYNDDDDDDDVGVICAELYISFI